MRAIIPFSIVAFALLCGVAQADPRDEVLQRLSHCNTLPDGRNWLDCYYAAAQPERSALGLAPAPQAPAFESLFSRPPSPGPTAFAAPPTTAPARREGGGLFSIFNADKVPPEQFGLTNARPGPGLNVDRVVDKLSSYSFTGGKFTVTLANGQVWRQTGGPQASWRSTPANYTATITFGALRTFNLRVQNGPNADETLYKVERIH